MYFFFTLDSDNMLKEFDTKGNCHGVAKLHVMFLFIAMFTVL